MVGMWIARCGVSLDKLVSLCNGDSDQLRHGRKRAELKTLSEQNGRAAAENEEVGVNGEAGDDAGTGSTVHSTNKAGTLGSTGGWLWITLATLGNGVSLIQEMSHEYWASTVVPHSASAEQGQGGRLISNSRYRLYCPSQSDRCQQYPSGAKNCDANCLLAGSVVGNPFSSVLRLHLPCRLLTGNSTRMEDQDISQLDDAGKWGRRAFRTHDNVSGSALITRNGK
ncbi:hypothetical protein BO79DRAFT_224681 [Aspergillus costaricaensis CBS 115574]|uniref:Uncharacterized protein n=1 Tax=Aspergillus costaricaensis CBS 115574 TaxID=1448317 RepID=A0ACD1IRV1_9EURO|nr:hypothetical protein BO79DRAFT_224681 [Aspergillus costaricaensis CBS 115574]RAK93172.1 hypothetical protein BO79DRAFT_224681 [Aspergillus costaricaensis CBS 115574]